MGTAVTRILIVDDHPVVRAGYRAIVEGEEGLSVCGEAESLEEALQLAEETRPHAMIVDVSLKTSSGLELVKEMKVRFPHVKLLVASMHDETLYAERALRAGASGYIDKKVAPERLVAAIQRILDDRIYLSDAMTDRLLNRSLAAGALPEESPITTLSDRELEVFELIGCGVTTREIAERLMLSPKTIETYRENIKMKLDLHNATELTCRAVQWVIEESGSREEE